MVWLRAFHRIYAPELAPAVLARLVVDFPDARLAMIGPDKKDGSLEQTKRAAESLQVQDRLAFPGAVPRHEVPALLDEADVFLNTADVDNAPVSVVEAMTAGLCIVSTRVGGIPYLLKDGHDALLVAPRDPDAMAKAVQRILTEPGLAARLSRNARKTAERFDWGTILPQWESLLAEAAERSRARGVSVDRVVGQAPRRHNEAAVPQRGFLERHARRWYVRWIRPHLSRDINRQRLKLVWFVWSYWRLLFVRSLSFAARMRLLRGFLRVDWHVAHAHRPCEIVRVCEALAERVARPHEVMVEAGCWQGGSSTKLSLICKLLDYHLHIYDSFEGVEQLTPEARRESYDFSGEYSAPETMLGENLTRYGEPSVCVIHKGWFADTLASGPVPYPVRGAYIDCDLEKGTREVLQGVMPSLVEDGWLFSQDFHIPSVRTMLCDAATWKRFGESLPTIKRLGGNLAALHFGPHTRKRTSPSNADPHGNG